MACLRGGCRRTAVGLGVCRYRFRHGKCVGQSFDRNQRRADGSDGRIVFELDDMSNRTEIPFSQQGNDAGGTETVYAITPISDFFLCDPQSADGGEYRVYTCTFDADTETVTFSQTGNTVWRIGGTDDKTSRVFGKSQIYNGRFATTGWGGEDWEKSALIVKMKATSDLKGRLRFGFGFVSADAVPKNWECTWSADGKSWNKGMEVAATPYTDFSPTFELKSTSPYKMARFSISEGQTIKKGNFLYIKIAPTDNTPIKGSEVLSTGTVTLNHGFYLTTHEKKAYNTRPMPDDDNIVLAHGFDEAFNGHDYFIPARYFLRIITTFTMRLCRTAGRRAIPRPRMSRLRHVRSQSGQRKRVAYDSPARETRRYAFRNHRYVRSGFLCVGGL